jgi:predicted transcriptional regulator
LEYFPRFLDYVDSSIVEILSTNPELNMSTTEKKVASKHNITTYAVKRHIKFLESLGVIQIKEEKKRSKKNTSDNKLRIHKMLTLDRSNPLVRKHFQLTRLQTEEYPTPQKSSTQQELQEKLLNLILKIPQSKNEKERYLISWKIHDLLESNNDFDRSFLEKFIANIEEMKENIITPHL